MVRRRIIGVVLAIVATGLAPLSALGNPQRNHPGPIKVDLKDKSGEAQVKVKQEAPSSSSPEEHSASPESDSTQVSADTLQALAKINPEAAKKLADATVEKDIWSLTYERPSSATASKVAESEAAYTIWQNDYLARIYNHQDRDTSIIFWMANLLVLSGIGFAALQFWTTLKSQESKRVLQAKRAAPEERPAEKEESSITRDDPAVTSISLSADGFSIKSSFLGIIILAISMLFYFGYLKYAYPISIASPDDVGAPTSTTAK